MVLKFTQTTTMARLKIREAIADYNRRMGKGFEPMRVRDVAYYVYRDSKATDESKQVMFSAFTQHKFNMIRLDMIQDICDFTGVPVEFLIALE